jgi:colanic acid/amylovoran biosynthesis glycosyltransferase
VSDAHHVAYIMSRFPGLSETFILREMCELERLGWPLGLYPLIYQEESVIHEEAKNWMQRAQRPSLLSIAMENIRLMFSRPSVYFSTLARVFFENRASLKFLSRAVIVFPKAVWMAHHMSAERIAHVHAHYATHPALAAWIINRITGIPYGFTVHAHDIFVDRSMLYRKILDAKYIVAISEYNLKFLVEHYGEWVAEKTYIIHCGIYSDEYVSKPMPVERGERFELVSIGSLRSYKGFTFLLDACSLLKESGINFRCRIIGRGELRESLIAQILKLDIGDKVELVGPKNQTEVAELLRTADCYVQPSVITSTGKMEGIPVSLMEAMASGVPVIASNISGIPELVRHEQTGLLVSPNDPVALCKAVLRIYNDPQTSHILAARGRDIVLREFEINGTVFNLSELFKTLWTAD